MILKDCVQLNAVLRLKRLPQGGESRDLFRLFRTCIRTGPVRKLFIISLILNEFSCGDVHMSCLCNQQTNIEVFCAYAL